MGLVLTFNKGVSLNSFYSSNSFWKRKKIKDEWKKLVLSKVPRGTGKMEQYTIDMEYNSRADPSNVIGTIKVVEDSLVEMGILIDDNKKYCKQIIIKPNLELKHNTYILKFNEYKQ